MALNRSRSRSLSLVLVLARLFFRSLSRAIGFFLFDDVEVPSLVWFTGSEDDIIVDVEDDEVKIQALLDFSHALWGDPMQERLFRVEPKPSVATWEGYGGDPIVFQKQETKGLWYNLYEALVVLVQNAEGTETEGPRVKWAKEAVPASVAALKEAKNYTQQK
ncbi:hypothetical protein EWM64_g3785 [Hericium alpestre]|uniref:CS domain-containing protein n=1 Tax=Hericium alpestre TaxID=135208 RepID=A0A4Y9ZZF3_9AGAM|nr:hypothetical protein EWM64_g3785 [Hericium alpestre]